MTTYQSLMTAHSVRIPEHLELDAEIPVLSDAQRQGDLLILPSATTAHDRGDDIPTIGLEIARGVAAGNSHLLVTDGAATWIPGSEQTLGTLTVFPGAAAYLLHPEHGAQGIAPGSYTIRRQREQPVFTPIPRTPPTRYVQD